MHNPQSPGTIRAAKLYRFARAVRLRLTTMLFGKSALVIVPVIPIPADVARCKGDMSAVEDARQRVAHAEHLLDSAVRNHRLIEARVSRCLRQLALAGEPLHTGGQAQASILQSAVNNAQMACRVSEQICNDARSQLASLSDELTAMDARLKGLDMGSAANSAVFNSERRDAA